MAICEISSITNASIVKATEQELVSAAKQQDEAAIEELWRRHQPKVFKALLRITRNKEDAEDALQEAFVKVITKLQTFKGESQFSTWLYRVATNGVFHNLRKQRTHSTVSLEGVLDETTFRLDPAKKESSNVETMLLKKEREYKFERAFSDLRPSLRVVLEHQVHGNSIEEIAEMVGITTAATKSRLLRARSALREAVA